MMRPGSCALLAAVVLCLPGCRHAATAPGPAAKVAPAFTMRKLAGASLALRPVTKRGVGPDLKDAFDVARGNGWNVVAAPRLVFGKAGEVSLAFPVAGTPTTPAPWRLVKVPPTRAVVKDVHGSMKDVDAARAKLVEAVSDAGLTRNGPVLEIFMADPAKLLTGDGEVRLVVPVR